MRFHFLRSLFAAASLLFLFSCEKEGILPDPSSQIQAKKKLPTAPKSCSGVPSCTDAQIQWCEEFTELDLTDRWNVMYNHQHYNNPNPTCDPNDVLSHFHEDALSQSGSIVTLENEFGSFPYWQSVYDYRVGGLISQDKFGPGYFEVKAKLPAGTGIGGAIWLHSGGGDCNGNHRELDIIESKGWATERGRVPTNYHYKSTATGMDISGPINYYFETGHDLTADYHTYGLEWTADGAIRYYFDHKMIRYIHLSDFPSCPMHILLTTNIPTYGVCPPGTPGWKSDWKIDYVRYYNTRPTQAYIATVDNDAGMWPVSDYDDWTCNWTHVIPCNINGDAYSDLLLYSRSDGEALFLKSDADGNLTQHQSYTGWRTSWDIIVPGDFGGTGLTDFLLYDRAAGEGEFLSVDGSFSNSLSGFRTTWDQIVAGNFNGSGKDDLLFYDKGAGEGAFYSVTTSGGLNLLGLNSSWRTTWKSIVRVEYPLNTTSHLFFYDDVNGDGELFQVSGGGLSFKNDYTLPTTFDIVASGQWTNTSYPNLICYDRGLGQANFYTLNPSYNLFLVHSYTDWRRSWETIFAGQFSSDPGDELFLHQ